MSRQGDREFEQSLHDAIRTHTEPLTFSKSMKDSVLREIEAKRKAEQASDGQSGARGRRPNRNPKNRRFWLSTTAGMIASVLMVGVVLYGGITSRHDMQLGSQRNVFGTMNHATSSSAKQSTTTSAAAATMITASIAPVESQGLILVPGNLSSLGVAHPGTEQGAANTQNGIMELAPNLFTVTCRIYNTSDQTIPAGGLQGMLFILNQQRALSPSHAADWEYFVDGPQAAILPHRSVSWSFTPNPSPSFTTLDHRVAHLVWVLRTPNTAYPTLSIGTLPVTVSGVNVQVTGVGGKSVKMQFLNVTATVKNVGLVPWNLHSALGMLFFKLNPSATLFSRQVYKYFDDITPQAGAPSVLKPGQEANVLFRITGVPGADMTRLPLTILLAPRSQIGG